MRGVRQGRGEINCLCCLYSCSKQGVSLRGLSFEGKKEYFCKDMINLGFWQYRIFLFFFYFSIFHLLYILKGEIKNKSSKTLICPIRL